MKKNFVFISYNHKDVKWAKWLQKKLEWYRLPTEMHNEFSGSRYIRPVFRDRDTLTSGVLNDELRSQLEASQYLVVICSPNSAQSDWVSEEVKTFIEMGRFERIVPFIVDGSPQDYRHSDITKPIMGECYPLALRNWNTEHPDKNLLGIAVTDEGKTDRKKAFIRLVAHLLGVEFDSLWQRHKRFIRRIITLLAILAVVAAMLAYWFVVPVKMSVTIKDEHSQLPGMEQGTLVVNGSEYSLTRPDTTIHISTLPGYNRLRGIPISFHADRFYTDETETIQIGMGITQNVTLQLHRDSTFAVYGGHVYDGGYENPLSHPIPDADVCICKHIVKTDANGYFRISLPLAEQAIEHAISITKTGYKDFFREDEVANDSLSYLLEK